MGTKGGDATNQTEVLESVTGKPDDNGPKVLPEDYKAYQQPEPEKYVEEGALSKYKERLSKDKDGDVQVTPGTGGGRKGGDVGAHGPGASTDASHDPAIAAIIRAADLKQQLGLPANVKPEEYSKALKASGMTEDQILEKRKEETEALRKVAETLGPNTVDVKGRPFDVNELVQRGQGHLDTQRWWKTDGLTPKDLKPVGVEATQAQIQEAIFATMKLINQEIQLQGRK